MKGVNTFLLNEATMVQIVQEWMNRNLITDPKPQVRSITSQQDAYRHVFEVETVVPETPST